MRSGVSDALEIAKGRLSRGEIGDVEYEEIVRTLRGHGSASFGEMHSASGSQLPSADAAPVATTAVRLSVSWAPVALAIAVLVASMAYPYGESWASGLLAAGMSTLCAGAVFILAGSSAGVMRGRGPVWSLPAVWSGVALGLAGGARFWQGPVEQATLAWFLAQPGGWWWFGSSAFFVLAVVVAVPMTLLAYRRGGTPGASRSWPLVVCSAGSLACFAAGLAIVWE